MVSKEFLLGAFLVVLTLCTITRYVGLPEQERGCANRFAWLALTVIVWAAWIITVFFHEIEGPSIGAWLASELRLVLASLTLLFAAALIISIQRTGQGPTRKALGRIAITAFVGCGLFMLPFVLWTQGDIPYYSNAMVLAIACAGATVAGGFWWTIMARL
jgi:hypothetical protein